MYNWGSKNFSSGGPAPKPEVAIVGEEREIGTAWGEVSGSETISGKFPRVTVIYGVKEKPLAPPSGKSRRQIFPTSRDLKGTLGRTNEPKRSEIVGPDFV